MPLCTTICVIIILLPGKSIRQRNDITTQSTESTRKRIRRVRTVAESTRRMGLTIGRRFASANVYFTKREPGRARYAVV